MSRLHELLDELAEQLGPPDEGMVAEAMEELTALVHRVRTADLPDRSAAPYPGHPCTRLGRECCVRDRFAT